VAPEDLLEAADEDGEVAAAGEADADSAEGDAAEPDEDEAGQDGAEGRPTA
jgi:hypothetical protein